MIWGIRGAMIAGCRAAGCTKSVATWSRARAAVDRRFLVIVFTMTMSELRATMKADQNAKAMRFVSRVIVVWLPYLGLQLCWQYLIFTDPDAAHGDLSGPVGFFLPALLITAVLLSLVLIAVSYFTPPSGKSDKP